MSRINVQALQQPANEQGDDGFEILPDDYQPEPAPVASPNVPDPTPHLTKISEQMSQLNNTATQNAQLGRLLADPEIQEILRARQEGRAPKLQSQQQQAQPLFPEQEEPEPEPDWQALAQEPQKMGAHLTKTVTKQLQKMLLPAIQQMMERQNAPLQQITQQMQTLQQAVGGFQQTALQQEMNAVRNVNPEEFDRLKPMMSSLLDQHPTLSFKQVYAMARLEAGLPVTQDHSVQTERPNSVTTTRAPQQQTVNPHANVVPNQQRRGNHPVAFTQQLQQLLRGKNFTGMPGVTNE